MNASNFKDGKITMLTTFSQQITLPIHYQPRSIRQQLIDWYLPRRMQHFLRSERQILINGQYQPVSSLLHGGEQITLNFNHLDIIQPHYLPSSLPLTICYEDAHLLIINKPAGQKTHPNWPTENDTAMNTATHYLNQQQQMPFITHRLDQATSGLLVIAKDPISAPILNRQLTTKTFQRSYLTIVKGKLTNAGTINLPIGRVNNDPRRRWINQPNSQPAITNYHVITTNGQYSVLLVQLQTGRTHQIRVHLAASGHPIVGDSLYSNDAQRYQRMYLHATQVKLILPFTAIQLVVNCPAPFYDNLPINDWK